MSDEGRRVFKMETVLALMAGKDDDSVSDLLGYLVGRELSASEEDVASPLAVAWLCKEQPGFLEIGAGPDAVYDDVLGKAKSKLGDNVSVTPIPDAEVAPIAGVLDSLAKAKQTARDQAAEIVQLKEKIAELEPFTAKSAQLEKKVEQLDAKVKGLEEEKKALKAQTAEFEGKLPVDESGLNATIKDIVTKALKDACAAMPVGAAVGAAVADGEAAPAEAAGDEAAAAGSGDVPDDFGFGATEAGDGFGF